MSVPKILIVEDEPAILRVLATVFTREGFRVVTAEDGTQGFLVGVRERPDVIIFDLVMPEADGIAMMRQVREEGGEWGARVKALIYTNMSYDRKREEAQGVGVSVLLIKANVSLRELIGIVRDMLQGEGNAQS